MRENAVPIVKKCLRTHYWRYFKPFPSQNALDCGILHVSNSKFFRGVLHPEPHRSVPGAWTQTRISVWLDHQGSCFTKQRPLNGRICRPPKLCRACFRNVGTGVPELDMDSIHPWIGLDWIGSVAYADSEGRCCERGVQTSTPPPKFGFFFRIVYLHKNLYYSYSLYPKSSTQEDVKNCTPISPVDISIGILGLLVNKLLYVLWKN